MDLRTMVFVVLTCGIFGAFLIHKIKPFFDGDGYIDIESCGFFSDLAWWTINIIIAILHSLIPTAIIGGILYMIFM